MWNFMDEGLKNKFKIIIGNLCEIYWWKSKFEKKIVVRNKIVYISLKIIKNCLV